MYFRIAPEVTKNSNLVTLLKLVEWSLPTLEDQGLNSFIGYFWLTKYQ